MKHERENLLSQRRELKAKIHRHENRFDFTPGNGSSSPVHRLRGNVPQTPEEEGIDRIYRQYKEVRARIRLTEALLTKQGHKI